MSNYKGEEYFIKAAGLSLEESTDENDQQMLYHLNSAIKLGLSTSDEAVAHYLRGSIYTRKGNLSEAEVEIKKALNLDKSFNNTSMYYVCAYGKLSEIYAKKGNTHQAIETLQNGILEFPNLFDISEEKEVIAILYFEISRLYLTYRSVITEADNQALLNLEQALKLNPNLPGTYFLLGAFHGDEKTKFYNPKKAIEYYQKYLTFEAEADVYKKHAQNHIELLRKEVEI